MKKYLLLFGVIISIYIQAYAERKAIYMDIYKYGHNDKRTTVHRSPIYSPYINATLNVSSDYSGLIIICIENEDWNATSEIAV